MAERKETAKQRSGVVNAVGAVAADIGRGVVESPSAIMAGINDAVRNARVPDALHGLDRLADWLNANVADLRVPIPKTGYEGLDRALANPLSAAAEGISEKLPDQKSVTGDIVRGGARFLTGYIPANRALGAMGVGGATRVIGAGAVSDFVTADPSSPTIANLLTEDPAVKAERERREREQQAIKNEMHLLEAWKSQNPDHARQRSNMLDAARLSWNDTAGWEREPLFNVLQRADAEFWQSAGGRPQWEQPIAPGGGDGW